MTTYVVRNTHTIAQRRQAPGNMSHAIIRSMPASVRLVRRYPPTQVFPIRARHASAVRAQDQPQGPEGKPQENLQRRAPHSGQLAPFESGSLMRLPSLFREMEREMNDLQRTFFGRDLFGGFSSDWSSNLALPKVEEPFMRLATDVVEEEGAFVVSADVPGMAREDLQIHVTPDRVLQISGERKFERKEEGKEGGVRRVERSHGHFLRSFALPPNVDEGAIKAALDKGVLRVTIPKVPAPPKPEPKQIDIQVAGQPAVEAPKKEAAAA